MALTTLRHSVRTEELATIEGLLRSTGMFREDEIAVGVELGHTHAVSGDATGYWFTVVAVPEAPIAGYACYGPIPCTRGSFDLYWIAVDPAHQGHGLGRVLIEDAERRMADAGGRQVFVDTSGRQSYQPTRAFYRASGYKVSARLPDFYGPRDDKVVFRKVLTPAT
jgi:ribosomal protein S18 acetylase RimI-like enzyme